jgi:bifunctional non-homologous end joining protein LigD
VKTSRSLDQIAGARDDVWGDGPDLGRVTGATKSPWPGSFSPQLAVLAESPPSGEEWLHEIKFDGYRFLARIKNGKVQLLTRNGKDWTAKFPSVAKALSKLKADTAIIDGEMVVLDNEGRSDFQSLQALLKDKETQQPVYFAFDLPFCNGFDLRNVPLIERKQQLEHLLDQSKLGTTIRFSEHVRGNGAAVIDKACGMALEGIISKQADASYVSRRDTSWLKSKCGQRQEFIVIGYTDPKGSRAGFGSLLLGYHDDKKKLVYAGRVGTGFDEKLLKGAIENLRRLKQDKPPTDLPVPAREQKDAHWVKPELVAEVKFAGWTRDRVLRHAVFVAFRSDKPAAQIVREMPVKPRKISKLSKADANSSNKRKVPPSSGSSEGVVLSHPDKVFYPDSGTTKQDLADYYTFVQQFMLPHVVRRPLALVRCPGGLSSKCFFQRNWSSTLPPAIDKVDVGEGKAKEFHVAVHDLAGIISMAQIAVLEIHTWNCHVESVEQPDQLIFDLDPGPDLSWKRIIEAARRVDDALKALSLPTFLKTSGGKGLHITIPIEPNIDWDTAKRFCATIAKSLAEKSDLFVANMRKDLRRGKVYLDYNRNGRSATAVAPYSTRARPGAPVSMPISWTDLGKLKSADHFRVEMVGRYLEKRKSDPWQDFEKSRVDLHKVIGQKSAA